MFKYLLEEPFNECVLFSPMFGICSIRCDYCHRRRPKSNHSVQTVNIIFCQVNFVMVNIWNCCNCQQIDNSYYRNFHLHLLSTRQKIQKVVVLLKPEEQTPPRRHLHFPVANIFCHSWFQRWSCYCHCLQAAAVTFVFVDTAVNLNWYFHHRWNYCHNFVVTTILVDCGLSTFEHSKYYWVHLLIIIAKQNKISSEGQ